MLAEILQLKLYRSDLQSSPPKPRPFPIRGQSIVGSRGEKRRLGGLNNDSLRWTDRRTHSREQEEEEEEEDNGGRASAMASTRDALLLLSSLSPSPLCSEIGVQTGN